MLGLPASGAVLQRPDGAVVGIDRDAKTYWVSPPVDAAGIQAKTQRTGEFSTIRGERVERITFRIDLQVGPATEGTQRLAIEGEAWVAERLKKYLVKGAAPGGLGALQLADLGLSLRQILRSPMFAGREIEADVVALEEQNSPASMFEIPADYKEVKMSAAGGG
jgi:hypothetical protein